jgi:diguanylate cyclase (GGDEF)-like protein
VRPESADTNGKDAAPHAGHAVSTAVPALPPPGPWWESLWRSFQKLHPGASAERLCERLARDSVLLSDLHLEAVLRVATHGKEEFTWSGPSHDLVERTAALQQLLDRLTAVTMEDGLTGLFNRRYFDRRLSQELQRAKRDRRPCSICIVDADDFKLINDTHGHQAGDAVLKQLALLTSDVLRATDDVTSRVGGEEFAVILPGTDATGAVRAAERVRARAETLRVPVGNLELRITVSVGVATYDPTDPCDSDELVRRADTALYAAKAAGKNTVRAHDAGVFGPPTEGVTPDEKDALLL